MTAVNQTLAERGKHYEGPGGYAETATTAQAIKDAMHAGPNWRLGNLTPAMREALDMIANKCARILNGNPNHADSWHDIAGYATLAENTIAPAYVPPTSETAGCASTTGALMMLGSGPLHYVDRNVAPVHTD